MKRLFVGIELPPEVKRSIGDYLGRLPKPQKGWENEHDLHLTLLFIGETKEEDFELIKSALNDVHFDPFEIKISGIDFFNRRIMFLSIDPSIELAQLRVKILNILAGKYPPETKPFIPHITIKRWQRYEFSFLKKMTLESPFIPLTFSVLQIGLYESKKDNKGDKYHVLTTYNKPY